MATITEDEDSQVSTRDTTGKITGVRSFFADVPPEVAKTLPEFAAIQTAAFVFFGVPVPVDRADVRPEGGGLYARVTAYYSTDRRWRLPEHVDRTLPAFKGWSISARMVDRRIPILVNRPVAFVTFTGPKFKSRWSTAYWTRTETIDIFSRPIVIQTTNMGVINAIRAQNDKVHVIQGTVCRFLRGTIDQTDSAIWETEYYWEIDPGTPAGTFDPSQPFPNPAFVSLAPARTPFTEYTVLPGIDPTSGQPDPSVKPEIKLQETGNHDDPLGWMSLPGGPF